MPQRETRQGQLRQQALIETMTDDRSMEHLQGRLDKIDHKIDEMTKAFVALARVEERIGSLLISQQTLSRELAGMRTGEINPIYERLRIVERKLWTLTGLTTTAGAVVGFIFQLYLEGRM